MTYVSKVKNQYLENLFLATTLSIVNDLRVLYHLVSFLSFVRKDCFDFTKFYSFEYHFMSCIHQSGSWNHTTLRAMQNISERTPEFLEVNQIIDLDTFSKNLI